MLQPSPLGSGGYGRTIETDQRPEDPNDTRIDNQ